MDIMISADPPQGMEKVAKLLSTASSLLKRDRDLAGAIAEIHDNHGSTTVVWRRTPKPNWIEALQAAYDDNYASLSLVK